MPMPTRTRCNRYVPTGTFTLHQQVRTHRYIYSAPASTLSSSSFETIRTKNGIECLSLAIIDGAVGAGVPPLPPLLLLLLPVPPPSEAPSSPKVPAWGHTRCNTAHGTSSSDVAACDRNASPAVTSSMPGGCQYASTSRQCSSSI